MPYAVLQLRNIAVLLRHTQFTLTQLILQAFDLRWQHRIRSPQLGFVPKLVFEHYCF